jgi:PAS domain S-box-containing protein
LFEAQYIRKKKNIVLLKIDTEGVENNKEIFRTKGVLKGLEKITRITFSGNRLKLYQVILETLLETFNLSKSFLFISNQESSVLERINKSDKTFPDTLPFTELERIKKVDIWNPGNRVLTEIHRIGRKAGLATIITIPTGGNEEGLIVLIDNNALFDLKWREELNIFSNWITNSIQFIDAFEKNQIERDRLLFNEHTFSELFEQSNENIVLINSHNKIIRINENCSRLLKYSPYELLGQDIRSILQNDEILALIKDENIKPIQFLDSLKIYDREGNEILINLKLIELKWGEEESKLIILSDQTSEEDHKQTIERLKDKASLGEMISFFAHDVRNPINDISTGLQLLRQRFDENDKNLSVIDRLQSDCIKMNDLMESILSFSRQKESDFKPFDILDLIERVSRRFNNKFQKAKIKSKIISNSDETIIMGNLRSIDQVFTNLYSNAIDAMGDEGGELVVKINKKTGPERYVEICITDTGRGIPDEINEKLFQPLVSGKEKGTGLGLAITKKIIDAHGGLISVESFTHGTVFTINLKLADLGGS